jgi:uncharacterized protein YkwD
VPWYPLRLVLLFGLGCSAAPRPRSLTGGAYHGEVVSFTSDGKQVGGFAVTGLACNGLDASGTVCKASVDPDGLRGAALLNAGAFLVDLGDVVVQGKIDGDAAKGTVTLQKPGCCTVTSDWAAALEVPASPVTGDASVRDGSGGGAELPTSGSGGPGPVSGDARARAEALVAAFRAQVGAAKVTPSEAITRGAQAHADYVKRHASVYGLDLIPGGVHYESQDFPEGYTGQSFADRMTQAGYTGSPGFEVMAFAGDPDAAITMWIESVYHRIPFVSPDMVDFGYGVATGVDVMDFGRGTGDPAAVIVYPVDGQTDVPTAWYGNEAPQPPPPPQGYPSGPVITLTVASDSALNALVIAVHRLVGPDGDVPHEWLVRGTGELLGDTWAMYAHAPLQPRTRYTVELEGKLTTTTWRRSWSFVTGD